MKIDSRGGGRRAEGGGGKSKKRRAGGRGLGIRGCEGRSLQTVCVSRV